MADRSPVERSAQTPMNAAAKIGIAGVLSFLLLGVSAHAQERKAYKHVDKAGNVTYSQTPPVDGKDAKKVNTAPAHQGRGGYSGGYYPTDPRVYEQRAVSRPPSAAEQRQTAQEQRMAAVKADCERNRGTDCNNPATLQYLDSTSIPRRGRY